MNPVNTKSYRLPTNATWLITGCSSGIGKAIAQHVITQAGQRLIATARKVADLDYLPDDNSRILKLSLDVSSAESVESAFSAIAAARFGGSEGYVDVLVNNAGYSLAGDTEAITEAEMHAVFETNFFGTVRVAVNAVRLMRQAPGHRGGLIFNISSVAGVCGFAGVGFYNASKFAVEGWTESFAREMHPDWNINFCIVEPSGVKTAFETSSKQHGKRHEAYTAPDIPARQLDAFLGKALAAGVGGLAASEVAEVIYRVASREEKVPLRLPLGTAAVHLVETKLQSQLAELGSVQDLAAVDKERSHFKF